MITGKDTIFVMKMSKAMTCVVCGNTESTVRNTRTIEDGMAVERRRTCKICGTRYITIETFDRIISPRKNRVNQPKIIVEQHELFE